MDENRTMSNTDSKATPNNASPPLGDIVDKLLANPEIIRAVASALSPQGNAAKSKSSDADSGESIDDDNASQPTSVGVSSDAPSADKIAEKLPEIMATLGPVLSDFQKSGTQPGKPPLGAPDRRTALLCALKPYLNPERCEAIDYIIKFAKLSDILKNLV